MSTIRTTSMHAATPRAGHHAWLVAAVLAAGAASATAQDCVPTATVTHPAEGGTSAALVVDGRGETFYDVLNQGDPRPFPRLTIDFGCTRDFVRLRRRMTQNGFTISGNRGPNREVIWLSRAGFQADRVLLSSAATSGWETYVPSEGGWQYVTYGWSAWLTLDGPPVEARYVIFDWLDNFDALNEIEVEFGGASPVDLWVDHEGTTIWLEDEPHGIVGTTSGSYTASYGNRGTATVTGVGLTLELHDSLRMAAGECGVYQDPPPGWTCNYLGIPARCRLEVGTLDPGVNRTFTFRTCYPAPTEFHVTTALVTELVIADDDLAGTEATPNDNRSPLVLSAPACLGGQGGAACCAIRALHCLRMPDALGCHGPAAPTDGQVVANAVAWSPLRWVGDTLKAAIDSFQFVELLYRVREQVFATTAGGRRATHLYEIHGQEIKELLLASATLRNQAIAALDAWEANLEALVDGRGGEIRVTAGQLAAITDFLAALRASAGSELAAAIDEESVAIGLAAWTGIDIDQAFARLNLLTCQSDAGSPTTSLCLGGGRFRVETFWETPQGQTGAGNATPLTDDTGFFWFFNAANVEVVVKALDGCPVNNRKWIFAAGLTNVRVTTTVTDTQTGAVKTYVNPINARFQPVQDISAFASCP